MRRIWHTVRSALLWAVSLLNFGVSVPILVVLAFIFDPKNTIGCSALFAAASYFSPVHGSKLSPRRASIASAPAFSFRIT